MRAALGVDPADTVAFGDGRNDVEMFAWAARSVAMGQAGPELRAVASELSTPVEGGRALGRFRLLGFPVHVDLSFVIFVGVLGLSQGLQVDQLVVWIVL